MSRSAPPSLLVMLPRLNLDWVSVGGVQCYNFSLLTPDVEVDLLCKDIELPDLLLNVCVSLRQKH